MGKLYIGKTIQVRLVKGSEGDDDGTDSVGEENRPNNVIGKLTRGPKRTEDVGRMVSFVFSLILR